MPSSSVRMRDLQLERLPLPDKCQLLNIGDQVMFPTYATNGGLSTQFVIHIVLVGEGDNPFFDGQSLGLKDGVQEGPRGWKLGTVLVPYNELGEVENMVLRRCKEMTGEQNA